MSKDKTNLTVKERMNFHFDYSPRNVKDFSIKLENLKTVKTNKKIVYYDIPSSFDIETSSFYNHGEKVAIMYCFSFCFNGVCYFGRTWEEFKILVEELENSLNLSIDRRLIVYVHNLSFEFQFIRKLFSWNNVFSLSSRKPIYALTSTGIEFRCSYLLSGYSLEKLGDNLRKYKVTKLVGDLDYSLIRHSKTVMTEKEIQYSINDVCVVVAYIQEEIERLGNISRIPLTKTGYVRNYCKKMCLYNGDRHNNKNYKKFKNLMNDLTLDKEEYRQLKRAFQGGFTHASARYSDKVLCDVDSIDFTSSYPYVMISEMFPMSHSNKVKIESKEQFENCIKRYCCLFDVEFIGLEPKYINENYISKSRCYNTKGVIENNGRVVYAESISTTITDVDYTIIQQCYTWEKVKIWNFKTYQRDYLPRQLILSILKLYGDKTELKGVENKEVEYMLGKAMLNSVYGMAVTDIVRDDIQYINDWICNSPDYDKLIKMYNNSKNRFLFYPWGVWVCAYARRNLWTGILQFGDDYIYSDTDSIKCLNIEKHMSYINEYNKRVENKLKRSSVINDFDFNLVQPSTIKGVKKMLGVWDWETEENKYTRFKTLGAKRYMIEQNNKINITVSGLNKKIVVPYLLKKYGDNIFKEFTDDLYIPKGKTGKMTHTYIDDERKGMIGDYKGIKYEYDELSSIHLEESDYSLNLSDEYINYLKGFRVSN